MRFSELCRPTADQPGEAVLFITHDLDEAIAMSDRVIVMSVSWSCSLVTHCENF
jgi:ABC-type nitrate/sulfonate/bicarbonate transport system ATPase subunit